MTRRQDKRPVLPPPEELQGLIGAQGWEYQARLFQLFLGEPASPMGHRILSPLAHLQVRMKNATPVSRAVRHLRPDAHAPKATKALSEKCAGLQGT
jgi:hypothetical protein